MLYSVVVGLENLTTKSCFVGLENLTTKSCLLLPSLLDIRAHPLNEHAIDFSESEQFVVLILSVISAMLWLYDEYYIDTRQ